MILESRQMTPVARQPRACFYTDLAKEAVSPFTNGGDCATPTAIPGSFPGFEQDEPADLIRVMLTQLVALVLRNVIAHLDLLMVFAFLIACMRMTDTGRLIANLLFFVLEDHVRLFLHRAYNKLAAFSTDVRQVGHLEMDIE